MLILFRQYKYLSLLQLFLNYRTELQKSSIINATTSNIATTNAGYYTGKTGRSGPPFIAHYNYTRTEWSCTMSMMTCVFTTLHTSWPSIPALVVAMFFWSNVAVTGKKKKKTHTHKIILVGLHITCSHPFISCIVHWKQLELVSFAFAESWTLLAQ